MATVRSSVVGGRWSVSWVASLAGTEARGGMVMASGPERSPSVEFLWVLPGGLGSTGVAPRAYAPRRPGDQRPGRTGLVDLGHRPSPGPRPQDDPRPPVWPPIWRPATLCPARPVRTLRPLRPWPPRRSPRPVREELVSGAGRPRLRLELPDLSARLRALHLRPLKPAKPTATSSSQRDQAVGRPRSREDTVVVIVADEPPRLTPGAARVLLCILLKAADRNDA